MTVFTAVGPLLDRDGMALKRRHVLTPHGAYVTHKRQWATPSANVRHGQASFIGVDVDHAGPFVGKVEHLERDRAERLWAVCTLTAFDPADYRGPLYFSPSTLRTGEVLGEDVEIRSIGICSESAQLAQLPVTFLAGELNHRGADKRWPDSELGPVDRRMLERAAQTFFERRSSTLAPITVLDVGEYDQVHDRGLPSRAEVSELLDELDGAPRTPMRHSAPHKGVIGVR